MSIDHKAVKQNGSIKWIVLFGLIAAIGLIGIVQVFLHGQEASYGVSRQFPWGLLLAGYIFLVVSSTGLCLISSLGHLWGFKEFLPIGKRAIWLALATLLAGFYIIFWELGGPFDLQVLRMIRYFIPFHYTSPILWMGLLYGLYMVFLILEFMFLIKRKWKAAFVWGLLGFLTGIAAHSNLGAVLGYNIARPFWHGVFLPIYFILSALISGSAIGILIHYFSHRGNIPADSEAARTLVALGKLLVLFLGIMLFFEIWKTITGLYGHPHMKYEAVMALVNGPLAINFWVFEIGFGIVGPSVLLLMTRFRSSFATLLASLSVMTGILFMRYDLLYAGQIVDVRSPYLGEVLYTTYVPTVYEITLFISALGVAGVIYFIGEKAFDLNEEVHA